MVFQKISYDTVEKAIENILDADVTPTLELVQRALSPEKADKNITTYFNQWREKNKQQFQKDKPVKNPGLKRSHKNIAEVERSLALARGVLESTNDGILVVSNEGKILDYNEKFIEVWGVPRHVLEDRNDEKALAAYPMTVLANPEEFYNNTMSIYKDPEAQGRVPDAHFKNGKILERYTFPLKIDGKTIGRVWSNRDITQSRKIDEILRLNKRVIEASPQGIMVIDLSVDNKNKIVSINPAFTEITGYSLSEAQGKEFSLFINRQQEQQNWAHINEVMDRRNQTKLEILCRHKNGYLFWGELHLAPVIDDTDIFNYSKKLVEKTNTHSDWHSTNANKESKPISHYVGMLIDINEKRKQEESLRLTNRAITASTHGIILINNNPQLTISYLNPASLRLLKISEAKTLQQSFLHITNGFTQYQDDFLSIFKIEKKGTVIVKCQIENKVLWLEVNIDPVYEKDQKTISHFVSIINDITKNKELENILQYKAVHDTLTGLPNKSYLEDAIRYRIKKAIKNHEEFGLLFIDIDRFKNINDTLGHGVGDELLCLFGERLQHAIQKQDVIARIGGDEFIILIDNIANTDALNIISKRLLESCRRKFTHSDHEFNISASIGIVQFPICGKDPETLIRNADIAMYQAKFSGRDRFCFYTTSLNHVMSRRVAIENELHNAIKNNEFIIYYQPIYTLSEKKYKKAEALIRWKNKKLGAISPAEFIPITEDIGMMTTIGRWVIETVIAQQSAWQKAGLNNVAVSLNVSAKQLLDENFVEHFTQTIDQYKISSKNIILEITESFFLSNEKVSDTLGALVNFGVKIAIDDFGTGYSNLNYLNKLHISHLKIDKSFIDQIDHNQFDDSVLLAIIAIGKRMQFKIIAEGVETKHQLEFLEKNECDEIQGYYFSKPLSVEDFVKFIKKNK